MTRRTVLALVALALALAVATSLYGVGDKGLLGRAGIKPRD